MWASAHAAEDASVEASDAALDEEAEALMRPTQWSEGEDADDEEDHEEEEEEEEQAPRDDAVAEQLQQGQHQWLQHSSAFDDRGHAGASHVHAGTSGSATGAAPSPLMRQAGSPPPSTGAAPGPSTLPRHLPPTQLTFLTITVPEW